MEPGTLHPLDVLCGPDLVGRKLEEIHHFPVPFLGHPLHRAHLGLENEKSFEAFSLRADFAGNLCLGSVLLRLGSNSPLALPLQVREDKSLRMENSSVVRRQVDSQQV